MIVTVTPTIMSGTVVRWHLDEHAPRHPLVSASRTGVYVNGWLHDISDELIAAAVEAYATLARSRDADVSHLATHRRVAIGGPLEPIVQEVTQHGSTCRDVA